MPGGTGLAGAAFGAGALLFFWSALETVLISAGIIRIETKRRTHFTAIFTQTLPEFILASWTAPQIFAVFLGQPSRRLRESFHSRRVPAAIPAWRAPRLRRDASKKENAADSWAGGNHPAPPNSRSQSIAEETGAYSRANPLVNQSLMKTKVGEPRGWESQLVD